MERKTFVIGATLAATLAAAAWGYGTSASAQPYGGPGMMGGGHGPGMMQGNGPGYGSGRMGGHGPGMMQGYGTQGSGPNEDCPSYGATGASGPGWMHDGQGYGRGWMHGDRGYGPGYSRGWSGQQSDLKLTTDDVKTRVERWLARRGNPRLKLGDVKEKDADTIIADVVTKDNSLVQRFVVNRHSGYFERDGE